MVYLHKYVDLNHDVLSTTSDSLISLEGGIRASSSHLTQLEQCP